MNNKNKQIRQSFTLEFKQSAAKLVNEKGYSQQQAAIIEAIIRKFG